jgi:hypothetical protein
VEIRQTPMTIADYCVALERGDIEVNRTYQRSDNVWPSQARSFLIETICSGYPIPKFILNQKIDFRTKNPIKEIVDGQQRSKTIADFYNNKLRLSRTLKEKHLAGKVYDELPEDMQAVFLNFSLDIDLFVGATFADVVEAFRRLNSYTFPVNAPEKRHARYQRGIKWFIFYFCRQYEEYFRRSETFSEKSVVRMLDTTLVAEVWHALENGIRTTKSADLDALYKKHDVEPFGSEPIIGLLTEAFDTLQGWSDLYGTALSKPYMIYGLSLAIVHVRHKIETLEPAFPLAVPAKIDPVLAIRNLTTLATAFESKDLSGPYKSFIDASTEKTNVDTQRIQRFRWFCEALTSEI